MDTVCTYSVYLRFGVIALKIEPYNPKLLVFLITGKPACSPLEESSPCRTLLSQRLLLFEKILPYLHDDIPYFLQLAAI